MKRIKFLLALLMVMLGMAVQAQQVVVYKTDGTTEVYQANQVDSVVYKPAPEYYYYVGTTEPTAANISSIGTPTSKSEWSDLKSVAHTNNSGATSHVYYCFPTDWNMVFFEESKQFEMSMASVGTFEADCVNYTVVKGGGKYGLSNGSSLNLWAKATELYWYLGSSDDCCLFNDARDPEHNNPRALNTNYSGWHTATTMPTWNTILGSEIGVDAAQDGYTWLIMPTTWFNKLIVGTAVAKTTNIKWNNNWEITCYGVEYTAVRANVTARLLYYTLK